MNIKKFTNSISFKILSVIFVTFAVLYFIAIAGTGFFYSKALMYRYDNFCTSVSEVVSGSIDADSIDKWLKGKNVHDYVSASNMLSELSSDVLELDCIVIYQMREDEMYTVFDTNSKGIRSDLGKVVSYDGEWLKHKSDFLAGKAVDNLIVSRYSGNVMMHCMPVFNSRGECAAYICSGVSMNYINAEKKEFMKKYCFLLLFICMAAFLIVAFYVKRRVVRPIKNVCVAMEKTTKLCNEVSIKDITDLMVKSGDEIENVMRSVIKIFTDKVQLSSLISKDQENVILTFATLIRRASNDAVNHNSNTIRYAMILTDSLRKKEKFKDVITDSVYSNIVMAAPLHDIGKLVVRDDILNKPRKLSAEEFEIIKAHSSYGASIIEESAKDFPESEILKLASQIAESHHERWDGSGYPYGLKGEEIPLPVRIISVVDVFDALVSKRCYKDAIPFDKAFDMVLEERGTHFDPDIIDTFAEIKEEIRSIYEQLN